MGGDGGAPAFVLAKRYRQLKDVEPGLFRRSHDAKDHRRAMTV
jgi:hypothetical protein